MQMSGSSIGYEKNRKQDVFKIFLNFCAAFVCGVAVAAFFGLKLSFIASIIFFVLFVVGFFIRKTKRFKKVFGFSLVAFFGALYFFLNCVFSYDFSTKFEGENKKIVANLKDIEFYEKGEFCYVAKIKKIEGERCLIPFNVKIYSKDGFDVSYCDDVEMTLNLKSCVKNSWFSFFNGFISSKTFLIGSKAVNVKVLKKHDFFSSFLKIRDFFIDSIKQKLKRPYSDFAIGMVFGNTKNMPYHLKRTVNRCGVSHMFAVSGLHINILSVLIILILNLFRCPAKFSFAVLFILLFSYVAVIGFCASALRACFMAFATTFGIFLKNKIKPFESVCFAAFLIILFWPFSIFGTSFLLSFSASIGIIFLKDVISNLILVKLSISNSLMVAAIESFSTSIAATLPSFIFVGFVFGKVSIVAPIINFLIMPFITIFFTFSLLLVLFSNISEMISSWIIYFLEGLFGSLIWFLEFVSKTYFCYLPTDYLFIRLTLIGILFYVIACFVLYKKFIFSKNFVFVVCLMIILPVGLNSFLNKDVIKIYFLGNGFGSSVVFCARKRTVVVNYSGEKNSSRKLVEFLDGKGVRKIDILLVAAKNNSKMKGMKDLYNTIPINCILLSKAIKNSSFFDWVDENKTKLITKDRSHLKFFLSEIDVFNEKNFGFLLNLNGICFCFANKVKLLKRLSKKNVINVAFLNDEINEKKDLNGCRFSKCFGLLKGNFKDENFQVLNGLKKAEFFVVKNKLVKGET